MRFHPTRIHQLFLCLIFSVFSFIFSCTKDSDILRDAVLNEPAANVDEKEAGEGESEETEEEAEEEKTEEQTEEEATDAENMEEGFESRTTTFYVSHDAHIQNGEGYNQHIVRVDKDVRTSYLKFDISAIDSIGGYITDAKLEFIVDSDEGNGTLNAFRGMSSDWTETNIEENSAPDIDVPVGSVVKEYKLGSTEELTLSAPDIVPEVLTLILTHEDGNDFAFASKEHPTQAGPKLIVTYNAPESAETIVVEEPEPKGSTDTADDTGEEGTTEETTAENQAPVAVADASPSSGGVPLEVSFVGSNSTDDTEISSYSWDFKDGSTANTADATHTFTEVGTYEVELTVTDGEGLTDTDTVTITVNEEANQGPEAVASANPVSGEAPLAVTFKGSDSTDDNAVTSYRWNFKDGASSNEADPEHTFETPGTYYVQLEVQDEAGLKDVAVVTITVSEPAQTNEAPVAVASGSPVNGEAPLVVDFTGSNSTDDKGITSYRWNFKDGSSSTETDPQHTFNDPGTYYVQLEVEDEEGLTDVAVVTVTVEQAASSGGGGGGGTGEYPPDAVMASSFGYNTSDATWALRDAINSSNSTIVVDKQAGDWITGPLVFENLRNKTIIFEPGVVLRAKSGAFRENGKRLFQMAKANNVEIIGYGATFRMNKFEYSGEQNHALSLLTCSNVTIKGLTLTNADGDGIYVSRFFEGDYCSNITIEDVKANNNKRQGMTVISVDGMSVRNSEFSGTTGKLPGAGVDLEPESTQDRLRNISFNNCRFTNNYGEGILFALSKMDASSLPIDVTFRNVYLSNNFNPQNSRNATEISLGLGKDYRSPVKGQVTFDGITVENSRWGAIWTKKTLESYSVTVRNAVFRNLSTASDMSVIHIGVLSYANTSTANMGGFTFQNVLIDYDGRDPSLELFGPSHGNWNLRNMYGEVRVKSPNGVRFSDNTNKLATSNSSTVTLRVVPD